MSNSEPVIRTTDEMAVHNGKGCAFTSVVGDPGLTKREYFAAMAMQALVSTGDWDTPEFLAKGAVKFADELLKELAK